MLALLAWSAHLRKDIDALFATQRLTPLVTTKLGAGAMEIGFTDMTPFVMQFFQWLNQPRWHHERKFHH